MRSVVFDCGNVLLRWDPLAVLRETFPGDPQHTALMREIFDHADWVELDRGSLEEEEANVRFARRTGRSLVDIRRLMLACKASLLPIPESIDLLTDLRSAGDRLYCLTNMSRSTFEFVQRRFDFWEKFDGILVSGIVGLIKPDPLIYRRLIATHGLSPQQTLFFDDRPENVESARSEGMQAYVFRSAAEVAALLTPLREAP